MLHFSVPKNRQQAPKHTIEGKYEYRCFKIRAIAQFF